MIYALSALLIGLCVLLYLAFGPGPRRRRAFGRASRLLDQGEWSAALEIIRRIRQRRLSPAWGGRVRQAEGECHQQAADEALRGRRYEDALRHLETAADLQGQDEQAPRQRVVGAMLAEARSLFAGDAGPDGAGAVLAL